MAQRNAATRPTVYAQGSRRHHGRELTLTHAPLRHQPGLSTACKSFTSRAASNAPASRCTSSRLSQQAALLAAVLGARWAQWQQLALLQAGYSYIGALMRMCKRRLPVSIQLTILRLSSHSVSCHYSTCPSSRRELGQKPEPPAAMTRHIAMLVQHSRGL
jgi:hypothetical protein